MHPKKIKTKKCNIKYKSDIQPYSISFIDHKHYILYHKS